MTRWHLHPERDALLAEAHARPYTPLGCPTVATRLATVSGEAGLAADRAHMTALCRRLGQAEPGPDSRWSALDAGQWSLRWERHTEFSTWTFFRASDRAHPFLENAHDRAPKDWLADLPGELLVATTLDLRAGESVSSVSALLGGDAIGARLLDATASVFTDLRPDAEGFTRYFLLVSGDDPARAGRLALALLEVETYRMMALLAFPVARDAGRELARIEVAASELAAQLARESGVDEDRKLLARLVVLAGEAEALNARTSFRFGAGRAYHEIVHDRIAALREAPAAGLQTFSSFMERRLAPAMRTCDTVAAREREVIDRIARTGQMLSTRVEVAASASSASLLASMDRRAQVQLRLQRLVEGLSVAAISYYMISLLAYVFKAAEHARPGFDATLSIGIVAPFVVVGVWSIMHRVANRLEAEAHR
ncbi:DUF3422 family protein [Glacieibacterium sp.]|uniref:DUF3422 family protein n=1 Tax=Glacieibacterium sp. TaxID=2860237 RepID=UPI003B0095FB